MTLAEIAEELRRLYPEAVAVKLFVNESSETVEVAKHYKTSGSSWKQLNGEWSPPRYDLEFEVAP